MKDNCEQCAISYNSCVVCNKIICSLKAF